jgi:hypothetical protein
MSCLSGRGFVGAFTAGRRFALTCGYENFAFQAFLEKFKQPLRKEHKFHN